jgi:hypothetical protein
MTSLVVPEGLAAASVGIAALSACPRARIRGPVDHGGAATGGRSGGRCSDRVERSWRRAYGGGGTGCRGAQSLRCRREGAAHELCDR